MKELAYNYQFKELTKEQKKKLFDAKIDEDLENYKLYYLENINTGELLKDNLFTTSRYTDATLAGNMISVRYVCLEKYSDDVIEISNKMRKERGEKPTKIFHHLVQYPSVVDLSTGKFVHIGKEICDYVYPYPAGALCSNNSNCKFYNAAQQVIAEGNFLFRNNRYIAMYDNYTDRNLIIVDGFEGIVAKQEEQTGELYFPDIIRR